MTPEHVKAGATRRITVTATRWRSFTPVEAWLRPPLSEFLFVPPPLQVSPSMLVSVIMYLLRSPLVQLQEVGPRSAAIFAVAHKVIQRACVRGVQFRRRILLACCVSRAWLRPSRPQSAARFA